MRALSILGLAILAGCALSQPATLNGSGLPDDLPYVTRAEWGAQPAIFPMRPQTPDKITVHHTATPQNLARDNGDKLRGLQAFSQRADTLGNGRAKAPWADVPYHFYVAANGTVLEGRDILFEGDSNTRYDLAGHIQIVVEGNFEETAPTAPQLENLTRLVRALSAQWSIPADAIAGHGDRADGQTACPGKALIEFLPVLRAAAG